MNLFTITKNDTGVNSCQGFIKIQPEALLHAARGKNGGAARLFFLAKHFNTSGSRTISTRDFRRWVLSLGISQRVYELWLARALQIGLITRRDQWLDLTGRARGYAILGCNTLYKLPALIPLKALVSKGWLSQVWAAYVKRFEDRPISQGRLRRLTGVPERNQRDYERLAKVVRIRNIALDHSRKPDQLIGIREHERPGAFVYTAGNCIAWGLPNSRQVNGVNYGNQGRNKKIKKDLNCLFSNGEQVNTINKVFYRTTEGLKAGLNEARKASIKELELPQNFYLQTDKVRFWEVVRI